MPAEQEGKHIIICGSCSSWVDDWNRCNRMCAQLYFLKRWEDLQEVQVPAYLRFFGFPHALAVGTSGNRSRCSLLQMANKKLYLSVAPPTLTTNNISSSRTRPFQSFSVLLGSKKPTSCMALHSIPGPNSLRTWQHCGGGIGVLVAAKGLPFFRLIPIHLVRTFL